MKPISVILFVFVVSLASLSLVVAQETCAPIGYVDLDDQEYCGTDATFQPLKEGGATCLNHYECLTQSCFEGLCQTRYESLNEQLSAYERFSNFLDGIECSSGSSECREDHLFVCGELGTWIDSGVDEACMETSCTPGEEECRGNRLYRCNDEGTFVDQGRKSQCGYNPGGGGNGGSGGSGGSGSSTIVYYVTSPRNSTYAYVAIPLRVDDRYDQAKFWEYSLNRGVRTSFTPGETIYAREGGNVLDVYARRTSNGAYTKKTVHFSVNPDLLDSDSYCGDGTIQVGEVCDDGLSNGEPNRCAIDCRGTTPSVCGNGIVETPEECDDGNTEDGDACSAQCLVEPEKPVWAWVALIVVLVLLIAFIALVLTKLILAQKSAGPKKK